MNVVHRDVSPQNVLVSFDGEVKVIDFGIAKAAGKATKTQAGILKGKFGYMSPEQIRGLPLDRRSDVFAIGICLYELLTSERLFVGDTDFSVLEKVRKVEVLPPSHFNRRIAPELERIVMKALAKDVDDRYQYASELAEDLRAFMYSTGNTFARKDLAAFMRATFAEDYEKEKTRLQDYVSVKPPEGMLAAAEAGYGGHLPSIPLPLVTGSAVTALPTGGPSAQLVMTPAANGLPAIARSIPTVGPASVQALGPIDRGPTVAPSLKLTAAAPVLGEGREDHQATIIAGGGPEAGPGVAPWQPADEISTDSRNPMGPESTGEVAAAWLSGADPGPPPEPRRPPLQKKVVHRSSSALGGDRATPTPLMNRSLRAEAHGNTRLIIALAGIVALLVLAVVAAVLLRPPAMGLVIIDVPIEVRSGVQVQINGETLTEKDGAPLREWPQVRSVKVGKATVRLAAPGYEPLFEIVEVKPDEPAELKKELKRSLR